ncbi:MAG: hypothetical protein OXC80_10460 [Gammaproteobacteria bacterium]|nr:hypothetical protein [Gammaproteobacteria bacterium]
MSEHRPTSVDELLDNVGDLVGVLHTIVDMNRAVMVRIYKLAEQFGIDFPETSDFADVQAEMVHRELEQWEDKYIGTSPPSGE